MMDLDDFEEDDEMVTIGSSNKWQLNKQIATGAIVDGQSGQKALYKYWKVKLAWLKGINTTHLNRHYKWCSNHTVLLM